MLPAWRVGVSSRFALGGSPAVSAMPFSTFELGFPGAVGAFARNPTNQTRAFLFRRQ
jgi:hypothetical protein